MPTIMWYKKKQSTVYYSYTMLYLNLTFWWSCRESNPGPDKQQNRFLHA